MRSRNEFNRAGLSWAWIFSKVGLKLIRPAFKRAAVTSSDCDQTRDDPCLLIKQAYAAILRLIPVQTREMDVF